MNISERCAVVRLEYITDIKMPGEICQKCTLNISNAQSRLICGSCGDSYHAKCCSISANEQQYMRDNNVSWKCPGCLAALRGDRQNTPLKAVPAQCTSPGNHPMTVDHFNRLMSAIAAIQAENQQNSSRFDILQRSIDECCSSLEQTRQLLEGNIAQCISDVADLRARNEVLEQRIKALENDKAGSLVCDIDEAVRELQERQKRSGNIMIFGLPEHSTADGDNAAIGDLLQRISVGPVDDLTSLRLGKMIDQSSRPRPLKVILRDEKRADDILRRAKSLKNIDAYKDVFLTPDRTPRQLQQYRNIKSDLQARVANGESDLYIKMVKGVPTIVKRSQPHLN